MTVTYLDEIKEYYQRTCLAGLLLQKPDDENIMDYKLVEPAAHTGWIPPGGVLLPSEAVTIPCIVVGLDDKTSTGDETTLNLRITVAVYDPGRHELHNDTMSYKPNFEGYKTLLNFMDKLEMQTLKDHVLAGAYELTSAIKSKMYEEQPYPYWYGCLQFSVQREAYPVTRYSTYI